MEKVTEQNKELVFKILKLLETHYSCADEIINKLKDEKNIEVKQIYPALSGLVLQNYLCYNWLDDDKGLPVKHFYLTRNGLHYIYK